MWTVLLDQRGESLMKYLGLLLHMARRGSGTFRYESLHLVLRRELPAVE